GTINDFRNKIGTKRTYNGAKQCLLSRLKPDIEHTLSVWVGMNGMKRREFITLGGTALVSDSTRLHTATKIFRPYPQSGLTAPNQSIRSASSIGTIVRSSAVVVGQRFERGVP